MHLLDETSQTARTNSDLEAATPSRATHSGGGLYAVYLYLHAACYNGLAGARGQAARIRPLRLRTASLMSLESLNRGAVVFAAATSGAPRKRKARVLDTRRAEHDDESGSGWFV